MVVVKHGEAAVVREFRTRSYAHRSHLFGEVGVVVGLPCNAGEVQALPEAQVKVGPPCSPADVALEKEPVGADAA